MDWSGLDSVDWTGLDLSGLDSVEWTQWSGLSGVDSVEWTGLDSNPVDSPPNIILGGIQWSPYGVHWTPLESIWTMGGTAKYCDYARSGVGFFGAVAAEDLD